MTAKTVSGPVRLLAALLVTASLCAVAAAPASAWPGNDKDLCTGGDDHYVSVRDGIHGVNPRGDRGVFTIRACSPLMRLPGLWIRSPAQLFDCRREHSHPIQGGIGGCLTGERLKHYPFLIGPEGQAVRYEAVTASSLVLGAIVGAGIGGGSTVAIGVVSCLAGLIPTGGISCLAIPAAAISAIVGAIGGVIEGIINNQLDRVIAMASSAWDFHVPPGWKGWIVWNGFGTIGHDYVDPSFSNLWAGGETPPFHMWAWFSAYPVGQGPNPDMGGSGASDRALAAAARHPITAADINPNRLSTFRGEIVRRGPDHIIQISAPRRRIHYKTGDNVLVATGAHDDLIGGRSKDVLAALGPFDRLYGGAGDDELLAYGRGDRVYGGNGFNELVAAGRGDLLDGTHGNDTLISDFGGTTVMAGRIARIDVDNGRGNDTVICPRVNRDIVIADRGDRVSRSCEYVFVNGRGAPRSPTMVGRRGFDGSPRGTRLIGPA
jgi:hypothetical protein